MEIARKPLFPFYVCEINFPTLNSAQAEAITWEIPALLNDTKNSTIRTDFITLSWFTLTHLPHCAEFSSKSIRTFYFNNKVHTVHISAKCISYSLEVYIYLYVFYLIWTLYPVYYSRAHARWSSWTRQVMLLFICAGVCVPACLHSHSAWRLETRLTIPEKLSNQHYHKLHKDRKSDHNHIIKTVVQNACTLQTKGKRIASS